MIDVENPGDLFAAPPPAPVPATGATTLGQRLRSARELRGLSLSTCAKRLRLPTSMLQRLEADDHGAPDHFVFLLGALRGYARFLELPVDACERDLRASQPVALPELVSIAHTPTTRWLLQRYGAAATYIVLTAFIAVPLVFVGLRGGLHRQAPRVVALDQVPIAAAPPQHPQALPAAKAPAATPAPDATPLRASLAPFAAIGLTDAADSVDDTAANPAPATPGQHTLTLAASADCWFEITGANGETIASGMLHAGDTRTWQAPGALHVTLGNADGVRVSADGASVDLTPFRHANVARFDPFAPAQGDPGSN